MFLAPFPEEETSDYIHSTWSDYSSFCGIRPNICEALIESVSHMTDESC